MHPEASQRMKSRHWELWFWLILALLIRLYKLTKVYCIAPDGTAYIDVARSLISGFGFHPIWPPFYPWLVSLLMRFGIDPELSGGLVSCIFGVLTVAMVYVVTKSMFSQTVARVATVFSVFHPFLVRYSAEVLADSLFTFLVTCIVFFGWFGLKRKTIYPALIIGVGSGLVYLTKPEGVFIVGIISIWWYFSKGLGVWYKRLLRIFSMWSICIILISPYLYNTYKETGRWMISQKQNIVFSAALEEDGYIDSFQDISPWRYFLENKKNFFIKMGKDLLKLIGRFPDAYNPLLFIFLIIGLLTRWDKIYIMPAVYISSFIIPYFLGYSIFHPGRRYLVNWVPLTLFLGAIGWNKMRGWISLRAKSQKGLTTFLLLVTIIILLPKTLECVREDGLKWKKLGLWIKGDSKGKVSVMAEDRRLAFYAGADYIPWDENMIVEADYIVTGKDISGLAEVYRTTSGMRIYHGSSE